MLHSHAPLWSILPVCAGRRPHLFDGAYKQTSPLLQQHAHSGCDALRLTFAAAQLVQRPRNRCGGVAGSATLRCNEPKRIQSVREGGLQ